MNRPISGPECPYRSGLFCSWSPKGRGTCGIDEAIAANATAGNTLYPNQVRRFLFTECAKYDPDRSTGNGDRK